VWPEHADAVHVLIACHNQWTVHLAAKGLYYQGLDFTKAGEAATWLGVEKSPALLWQLRILEDEAKKQRNSHL
jgi:hypothetical protein